MTYLRSFRRIPFRLFSLSIPTQKKVNRSLELPSCRLQLSPASPKINHNPRAASLIHNKPTAKNASVTIPAGTHAGAGAHSAGANALHPSRRRHLRPSHSPVGADNQVVIPPGTFVQGMVDKIQRTGGRGELRLQSMSITFPDGYMTPILGPMVLETTDGYAIKDPGSKRARALILAPHRGRRSGSSDWPLGRERRLDSQFELPARMQSAAVRVHHH